MLYPTLTENWYTNSQVIRTPFVWKRAKDFTFNQVFQSYVSQDRQPFFNDTIAGYNANHLFDDTKGTVGYHNKKILDGLYPILAMLGGQIKFVSRFHTNPHNHYFHWWLEEGRVNMRFVDVEYWDQGRSRFLEGFVEDGNLHFYSPKISEPKESLFLMMEMFFVLGFETLWNKHIPVLDQSHVYPNIKKPTLIDSRMVIDRELYLSEVNQLSELMRSYFTSIGYIEYLGQRGLLANQYNRLKFVNSCRLP
jgi:hypothetical protein